MPRGRPTKFNDTIRQRILELAAAGKTDAEMAVMIGVTPTTMQIWKVQHPDFFNALKKAKGIADELVEVSLFRRAMGYSHPETVIKVMRKRQPDGSYESVIHRENIMRHYPPDPTSMIFWLKNRRPKEWRDVHKLEHSGADGKPLELKQQQINAQLNAVLLDPKAVEAVEILERIMGKREDESS